MRLLLLSLLLSTVIACSPNLNYLGDIYEPTQEVDVYYDQGDIDKEYKVIGQLSGDNQGMELNDLEDIKKAMVQEAKMRGANGILFLFTDSIENSHIVKAKLIRYRV